MLQQMEPPPPPYGASSQGRMTIISLNLASLKTIQTYFKLANILTSILGAISAGWRFAFISQAQFFHFVSITCALVHTFIIVTYLFNLNESFKKVPWNGVQLGIDLFYSTFYLLASAVCADVSVNFNSFSHLGAATFFGLLCFVGHTMEAGYIIIQWKQGVINLSAAPLEIVEDSPIVRNKDDQEEGGYQALEDKEDPEQGGYQTSQGYSYDIK